jgi:rhamnogalacturonyl hydrolase YesR
MKRLNPIFLKILIIILLIPIIANAQDEKVFSKKYIEKSMEKAAFWQLKNPKHALNDWTNAAFYAGVFAAYETTGSNKLYEALLQMGESNKWMPGNRWYHADDQAIGQTYVDIYRIEKDKKMIQPLIETLDVFMKTPFPVKGKEKIAWWWCDALFMAPPTLVKLGVTLGEDKYLELNDVLFHEAYDLLWDQEENLFARDLDYVWGYENKVKKESNGEKIFWSRGNGWVMGGLAKILEELPADYPERNFYLSIYNKMANRIQSLQQKDGLWRSSLLDPDNYPGGEASGSGFFIYALAWGINNHVLPKEKYLPVIKKGWIGLCGLQKRNGMIGWVQPIGADPRKNFTQDSWEVYGTGAFLLAGSEVIKLGHN